MHQTPNTPTIDATPDPLLNHSDGVVSLLAAGNELPDDELTQAAVTPPTTPKKSKLAAVLFSVLGFVAGVILAALLWAPLELFADAEDSSHSVLAEMVGFMRGESAHPQSEQWGLQAEQFKNKTTQLNKGQQQLVSFLAKKYRIASSEVRKMVSAAYSAGTYTKQDPLLILAVMSIESNLNPVVESAAGAQGLMQIMPKVHAARFAQYGGIESIFHIDTNVLIGARILQDCIKLGGNTVEGGLKCYVGASGPSDGGYGAKVLSARDRLARAAEGDFDFTAPKPDLELKPSTELLPMVKLDGLEAPTVLAPTPNATLQLNSLKPAP